MILHRAEFSPASESFVGWRDLESASLYASSTGAQLTDLGGEVHEAAYAPNGARLLTLPGGTLIDARTGATIAQLPHLYPTKRSVSFSADGALFAARTIESGWRVHEAASGRLLASLAVGGGVLLAPNGRRILATDRDPPILDPFEPMETYLNRPFPIATLRDGRGALLASLGPVSAFAFSPDGASLITRFNTLTLWDARDGRRIAAFDKFTNFVWSPASDRLVGYGYTSGALIDSSTGRALTSLAEMERGAASLRWLNANGAGLFSPNGALVAVRGGAGAKLYNARTGAALAEASGALFSPDGRWLFGGGSFYDVAAQRTSFRLQRLDGLSPKTVFSDDSASYFTDIPLKMIALRLDRPLNARPGARRRAQVCGANAASIGAFDQLQRHRRASSALAEHLIGRPWSPCDWRGALSPDGWAQALRYWAVRLGADWDYEEDECAAGARGFGCPKRPDRNR
jgi:WD40 repeat protein